MKKLSIWLMAAAVPFFFSCDGGGEGHDHADHAHHSDEQMEHHETPQQEPGKVETPDYTMEKHGIKLVPLKDSPKFPGASLSMKNPEAGGNYPAGKLKFDFEVKGYELGAQTADAGKNGLANSGDGQHVHLILNNGPYTAHYMDNFDIELQEGSYVALAFLSRSYHESLKNKEAYVLTQFSVGEANKGKEVDLSGPVMFYSRPKGTYQMEEARRVLLDFYLHNVTLSKDGYKVKVSVNGADFWLAEWQPYVIQGLLLGKNHIRLELFDAGNRSVKAPFNPVEREITIAVPRQ